MSRYHTIRTQIRCYKRIPWCSWICLRALHTTSAPRDECSCKRTSWHMTWWWWPSVTTRCKCQYCVYCTSRSRHRLFRKTLVEKDKYTQVKKVYTFINAFVLSMYTFEVELSKMPNPQVVDKSSATVFGLSLLPPLHEAWLRLATRVRIWNTLALHRGHVLSIQTVPWRAFRLKARVTDSEDRAAIITLQRIRG